MLVTWEGVQCGWLGVLRRVCSAADWAYLLLGWAYNAANCVWWLLGRVFHVAGWACLSLGRLCSSAGSLCNMAGWMYNVTKRACNAAAWVCLPLKNLLKENAPAVMDSCSLIVKHTWLENGSPD